jgi:hypothetical protein
VSEETQHPLVYGYRNGRIVFDPDPADTTVRERYARCPTCEQWSPCDVRKSIVVTPNNEVPAQREDSEVSYVTITDERFRKLLRREVEYLTVRDIARESEGVSGYHLNGDVLAWGDFFNVNV